MKKYTRSIRFRRHQRSRMLYELKAKREFKSYQKSRRRRQLGKRIQRRGKRDGFRPVPYDYLEAPAKFSFAQNPEEMCAFIQDLQLCLAQNRAVFVILSRLEDISYDGILVLLSVMLEFRDRNIPFSGDIPKIDSLHAMLLESGFFKHLSENRISRKDRAIRIQGNTIVTHGLKKVDSKLSESIISRASEIVWGERRRCTGLQRALLELMQNTNNHASRESAPKKCWWLSVKHLKEERRVAFSFVDYGVGVFESLRAKPEDSRFYGVLNKLYRRYLSPDSILLKKILRGALHRSVTNEAWRGKGLPGIYRALKRGSFSNLVMITNSVYYDSRGDQARMLNKTFNGTFVYFELCEDDKSLPYHGS